MAKPDSTTRFPFISLKKALDRARQIYDVMAGKEISAKHAFDVWEYSGKSSGGFQTIAALKMYGLIRQIGHGDNRKIAVSEECQRYFKEERPKERQDLLQGFALKPALLRHLWDHWGGIPADEAAARSYLKIDRNLSDQGARSLIGIYKANSAFSGIKSGAITPPAEVEKDGDNGENIPPPPPPAGKGRMKIMEGERELTTGLLSKNANFRLIVDGPVGVKEIERLIRKLELDKEILASTEAADDSDDEA